MTYCSWDLSDWDKYSAVQAVVDIRKAKTFLDLHGEKYAKFLWVKAHKKISSYTRFIEFQIPRGIKTKFFLYCLPWNFFNEIYSERADEFFEKRADQVLPKGGVDVVLIDGDHSFEQTLKDVNNCLRYLSDDGVIVIHDCSPSCEISATPSKDIPLYKRRNTTLRLNLGVLKLVKFSQLTEADLERIEDYVKWDKVVCQAAR